MDDEFDDYFVVTKPRFKLVSGTQDEGEEIEELKFSQTQVYVFTGLGVVFVALGIFTTGFVQFMLLWIAAALIVGPHAPSPITGGDFRVGLGELLPDIVKPDPAPEQKQRGKSRKQDRVAKQDETSNANGSNNKKWY